jgi:hypothetical protein
MKVVRKMTFGSKSQKTCNYATIASEENGWDSLSTSGKNSQDPLQFMSYSQATCFHEDRLQDEHATTILEVATRQEPLKASRIYFHL